MNAHWVSADPIIGRETEVATVLEMRGAQPGAMVTIVGPGGVGKTRLARRVGEVLAESGPVWFVPLAPVAEIDRVPAAIAGAGGREVSAEPDLAWPTLRHLLEREPVTLILDNLEHLPAIAAPLAAIAAIPSVTILATSRRSIGLDGEHVFELAPLATADPDQPGAGPSAAASLFMATGRADVDSLAPDDLAAIESICRSLDGLPLAVELVASRLAVMSPQALSGLVAQRRESVLTLSNGHGDHHRTLQATIQRSYDVVSRDAQTLLQAMAVAVAGISHGMATAILDGREADAIVALQDLALHHLAQRRDAPGAPVRFALLETIRAFAAARLDRNADRDRIVLRILAFLLAEAGDPDGPLRAVEEYERDLPTIIAVVDRAFLSGDEDGITAATRLVVALCPLIESAGPLAKGASWLEQSLFMLPDHHPLVPDMLANIGRLVERQGHLELAEGYVRRSLALCGGDSRVTAFASRMLGMIRKDRGFSEDALDHFDAAFRHYAELEDVEGLVRTENVKASVYLDTGDLVTARTVWLSALDRARAAGLHEDEVRVRANLAFVTLREGDPSGAVAQYEAVIADAVRLNYRYIEAQAEENIALAWYQLGEPDKAMHHGLRAVERWRRYGNPLNEADIYNGFASISWLEGDLEQAITWVSEGIAIYRLLRQRGLLAFALVRLACFLSISGDDSRAAGIMREAGALLPDTWWPAGESVIALLERAQDAARAGDSVDEVWVAEHAKAMPAFGADRTAGEWIALIAATAAPSVEEPRDAEAQAVLDRLSAREREVLVLIAAGKSNAEIGWELSVSERTAIFHVSNILRKLDVTTRIDAATWAIRHHVV